MSDEKPADVLFFSEVSDPNDWTPSAAYRQFVEDRREEGRREVLREIAALLPEVDEYGTHICPTCHAICDIPSSHAHNCLWFRAQAVKD